MTEGSLCYFGLDWRLSQKMFVRRMQHSCQQSISDNWFEMFRMTSFAYFECQGGNFELDSEADGKPVESLEDQHDVIVSPRASEF